MIIGVTKINYYGFLLVLSIIISATYIYNSIKKEGFNDKYYLSLFLILYFSSILIFGLLFNMITHNLSLLDAGFSSYGGLIGVIISALIFDKKFSLNNLLLQYSIISLPLTYGISKMGCFLAGCCYGIPYNGVLSVTYTNGLNIPLFPIQIVESIVFVIIFIILYRYKTNKNIIYYTVIISALMKYLLDFLRYDHLNKIITVNQIFSIFLILCTIIFFIRKYKHISK